MVEVSLKNGSNCGKQAYKQLLLRQKRQLRENVGKEAVAIYAELLLYPEWLCHYSSPAGSAAVPYAHHRHRRRTQMEPNLVRE